MRFSWRVAAALAAAIAVANCGGGDNNPAPVQNPAGPGTVTPVTISIVGTRGNQSYQPNPVPVQSGEQIVFKNNDSITHHIVMKDGSADFGNLGPGASSTARTIAGGDFYCTLHPSMVGSINAAVAPDPPPGSGDGY